MGVYRYILALLVLLSHLGVDVYGYSPGVVAVISFYLLSGFVMSALITKYYRDPPDVWSFYIDRAARLFPQFLCYSLIATAVIICLQPSSPYLSQLTPTKWFLNLWILPQAFYMFWAEGALVIPQSWSLGLETTFYVVIPWILLVCGPKRILALTLCSFAFFFLAYLGVINSDWFGYRLLPGTLYIFLVGASIQRSGAQKIWVVICWAVFWSAGALLLAAAWIPNLYQLPYNKEVLLGLIIGIILLSQLKKLKSTPLDQFLGNLSYGIFLNHFILIWLWPFVFKTPPDQTADRILFILASSFLAWLTYIWVEKPALAYRHQSSQLKPSPFRQLPCRHGINEV